MSDDHNISHHILVVEESATLRFMLSRTIQNQGYELTVVKNFSAAVNALKTSTNFIHAIIVGWPTAKDYKQPSNFLVHLDCVPFDEVPVVLLTNLANPKLINWTSSRKSTALITWENYQETVSTLQHLLSTETSAEVVVEQETTQKEVTSRVLFVDDSRSLQQYYKRMLERHNYQVKIASSVDEAYALALENPFDIAIVDYFMPEQNGYVLCQKLRDNPKTATIRTAVITGTYLDSVIKDCLQAGAIECMFKNESEELFLARLDGIRHFIKVQQAIEKERENLAAILESVGEGVYGVDTLGLITFINTAALSLFGINDKSSAIAQKAHELFHSNTRDIGRDRLKEAYFSGKKLKGWETTFRQKNGKEIPVDCTLHPLTFDGELQGSVIAFRDISERKLLEGKLRWQATHDNLTGLHNRRYFETIIENELKLVKNKNISSALIYINLDRFKYLNDTAGHDVGDKLLIALSQTINQHSRRRDTVARIGGDEFGLVLKNVNEETAKKISEQIKSALSKTFIKHNDKKHQINASIGIAIITIDNETAGEIIANADIACHVAKRLGRNQTYLYEKGGDERNLMGQELGWSNQLKDAIKHNRFKIFYQPIIHTDDVDVDNLPTKDGVIWKKHLATKGKTYNYEILIRLLDENNILHSPDSFIPTAERFNLMMEIDMLVFELALQEYNKANGKENNIYFSINLSGNTINGEGALDAITQLIKKYKIDPSALTFEITETCAIANLEQANSFIRSLRQQGCRFSLDDFGSGYCSFSQLKNLITDYVKIDGQFVQSMARGTTDRAIVTAMNDVAHSIGRLTVAEYVESAEILRLLKICGVDKLQGHYISKPLHTLPHGNN